MPLKELSSIFIIVFYLFCLVAIKMHTRKLGYVVFKNSIEYRKVRDEHSFQLLKYTKMTNMHRLKVLAEKNQLKGAVKGQVIQMTGSKLALPH